MKRRVSRVLFGERRSPQYAVLGTEEPQSLVSVVLTGSGEPLDVTRNNVVVSLRPMRVAVALPSTPSNPFRPGQRSILAFHEHGPGGELLGRIGLHPEWSFPFHGEVLHIFRTGRSVNRCVSQARRRLHEAYWWWAGRGRSRHSHGVRLRARDFRSFLVFYTCPRPVALVSAGDESGSNIFPMDLMGPAGESLWLFALRSTTPAVEVIRRTRRMTVSAIPVELRDVAYALGRNHRVPYADAAAHPFVTIPSPSFELPAPADALRVTDFDVMDVLEPGSHTVFVSRQRSELQLNAGLRMCHVQGFYQKWSSRQERTAAAAWNRGES